MKATIKINSVELRALETDRICKICKLKKIRAVSQIINIDWEKVWMLFIYFISGEIKL